jgi:hypothetical protein
MVGSHVGRVHVVDQSIRPFVETLADLPADSQGSTRVTVRTGDEYVRLIAMPPEIPAFSGQHDLLAKVMDGVVKLDPNENGAAPTGSVLEAIRSAFTRKTSQDLNWPEVFDRLWAPIERALKGQPALPAGPAAELRGGGERSPAANASEPQSLAL